MSRTSMFSALACALMTAQTAEGGEGSAAVSQRSTASIRPDLSGYQTAKSASGSSTKICGDEVSQALVGATLDEAYAFVAPVVGAEEDALRAKYGERNVGQQRMFLGNLIRGAFSGKDIERAATVKAAFDEHLPALRAKVDERAGAAAEAKAKAQEEKEKAKADAKAKKEADKAQKLADSKANALAKADAKAPKPPKEPKVA